MVGRPGHVARLMLRCWVQPRCCIPQTVVHTCGAIVAQLGAWPALQLPLPPPWGCLGHQRVHQRAMWAVGPLRPPMGWV